MAIMGQDQYFIAEVPITSPDITASTYMGAGYPSGPIYLPEGYEWEVINMILCADTTYSSPTNNYNYSLNDSSGNTIATVNTAAVAHNFTGASDTSMTAAYANIDTSSAASYLSVTGAISGTGHVVRGLRAVVTLKRKRAAS